MKKFYSLWFFLLANWSLAPLPCDTTDTLLCGRALYLGVWNKLHRDWSAPLNFLALQLCVTIWSLLFYLYTQCRETWPQQLCETIRVKLLYFSSSSAWMLTARLICASTLPFCAFFKISLSCGDSFWPITKRIPSQRQLSRNENHYSALNAYQLTFSQFVKRSNSWKQSVY